MNFSDAISEKPIKVGYPIILISFCYFMFLANESEIVGYLDRHCILWSPKFLSVSLDYSVVDEVLFKISLLKF